MREIGQKQSVTKSPKPVAAPFDLTHQASPILQMQRTVGNQAVQQFLAASLSRGKEFGKIQPKLSISEPGDVYEQEADRVADTVMRMPGPATNMPAGVTPVFPHALQRMCHDCEEEHLHRKESGTASMDPGKDVESEITSLHAGEPLSASERTFFEPRFGRDFSSVRIHSDARAAGLAENVSARAFTLGNQIVFNSEQYSPETDKGRHLLAHELTHVVQQGHAQRKTRDDFGPAPSLNQNCCQRTLASEHEMSSTGVLHGGRDGVIQRDRLTNTLVGAGIGAVIGGGLGALIGGPVGALVGAGIGALIGGVVGALSSSGLTITRHSFSKGTCGQRNVQWVFGLDSPAPDDGYIVQEITGSEAMANCPAKAGTPAVTSHFWEAWLVKKGDKVDWTTTRDAWTDGSTRPANPNTNGTQSSAGIVKFFTKATTGDLGDFGVAPVGPGSAWGPGKVTTSGALPSTPSKPSWWDNTPVAGPTSRVATSVWNCCDTDSTKHTSDVTANP